MDETRLLLISVIMASVILIGGIYFTMNRPPTEIIKTETIYVNQTPLTINNNLEKIDRWYWNQLETSHFLLEVQNIDTDIGGKGILGYNLNNTDYLIFCNASRSCCTWGEVEWGMKYDKNTVEWIDIFKSKGQQPCLGSQD